MSALGEFPSTFGPMDTALALQAQLLDARIPVDDPRFPTLVMLAIRHVLDGYLLGLGCVIERLRAEIADTSHLPGEPPETAIGLTNGMVRVAATSADALWLSGLTAGPRPPAAAEAFVSAPWLDSLIRAHQITPVARTRRTVSEREAADIESYESGGSDAAHCASSSDSGAELPR